MSERGYSARRYHGSVSSGQDGDISDASVETDMSRGDSGPGGGDSNRQWSAEDVKSLQIGAEGLEGSENEGTSQTMQGDQSEWGVHLPSLHEASEAYAFLPAERILVNSPLMPPQQEIDESHSEAKGCNGDKMPSSPLNESLRRTDEKSSSYAPGGKRYPGAPPRNFVDADHAQETSQDAEERRSEEEASSGEESTSQLLVLKGWQASSPTATRADGDPEKQEDEVRNLHKTLAAAQASARRWRAAATASDSQARGFQVALAATEQTMQALNNRHVGEFAAAWERIREMEKRMGETVQEHAAQLATMQAELMEKQKLIDTGKEMEERARSVGRDALARLEAENRALEDALVNARSELECARSSEEKKGFTDSQWRQLEDELAEAREREAKRDLETQAKLAEAEEAVDDAKQQARDASQQAEERWQEILAKRDAKRVEELRAKEQENRELLEVAEDRLRDIGMLQEEVSDLQGSVSEMEWMKERMAGFERKVLQEVSGLSRELDAREEVIDSLQAALKSAREALVTAEADLRKEEKRHRGKAAEKARDFASELSEVESLYRIELQRKETQMQGLEAELRAVQDEYAEQRQLADKRQGELLEEKGRNEEKVATVSAEIDALRARIVGAESAGKVAAALVAELEESCAECDLLRERLTGQQLEHVEMGQQVSDLQQQVELERAGFVALEAGLRNSLHSVESDLSKVESQKQDLEEKLGAVSEELGITGGPAELVVAVRTMREETDRLRRAVSDAVSEVKRLRGMEEQAVAKTERMKELRNTLLDAKRELSEVQAKREFEAESFTNQISQALEQARSVQEAKESLERECAEEVETQEKLRADFERALSDSERELRVEQSLRRAAEERNAEVHTLLAALRVKEEEREELECHLSELRQRVEEHRCTEIEAQTAIEALKGEVDLSKSQLAQSEARQLEEREKAAVLEGKLRERDESLSKLTASLEASGSEHQGTQGSLEATRDELAKATSEVGRMRAELGAKEKELTSARGARDEIRKEVERLTLELEVERREGGRRSEELKRHVEAAAEEYRRARTAVKAELDRVNGVAEQERITASLALRDAKQSQHNAEDRCESLERELRTSKETLSLRISNIVQLREQALQHERALKDAQQRVAASENDVKSLQAEAGRLKEHVQERDVEMEKLRKMVKAKEKAIGGLEERLRVAEAELTASEKRVIASSKEAERERRGKKELVRKAEAANAAAEKSAHEKGDAERLLADALKRMEKEQKGREQLEREVKLREKERREVESALRAAEGASSPLREQLDVAESVRATCQKEKQALEEKLVSSQGERLEILEVQAATQREKQEALVGLQEALEMVESVVSAKERAEKALETAYTAASLAVAEREQIGREVEGLKRDAEEARERVLWATQEAQAALVEKRAAVQEKEAIIETVEEVLASIEHERADLFAMARAAAAELAHEMRKVKQLQSSLQRNTPHEQPCLKPSAWLKGSLVKQYLASDLALRTRAGKLTSGDWVLDEETLLLEGKEGALWDQGGKGARKADQGTNTESFVIATKPGCTPLATRQVADAGVQTADALGMNETETPVLMQQIEELQRLLEAKEQESEAGLAIVCNLESELAASRNALDIRGRELEAEKNKHVTTLAALSAQLEKVHRILERECRQVEAAHLQKVDALETKLSSLQERLDSVVREQLRLKSFAQSTAQPSSRLPGLRSLGEDRASRKPELKARAKTRSGKPIAGFTEHQGVLLQLLFLTGHMTAAKEAPRCAGKECREAGVNTDCYKESKEAGGNPECYEESKEAGGNTDCYEESKEAGVNTDCEESKETGVNADSKESTLDGERLRQNDSAASESARILRRDSLTFNEALEAKVKSLEEAVGLREAECGRLRTESRRALRLVEKKEEEIEGLQSRWEANEMQLMTRSVSREESSKEALADVREAASGEGHPTAIDSPHQKTGAYNLSCPPVEDDVSSELEDDVIKMSLSEARSEIARLREVLRASFEERQAAEAQLMRAFADDLQTAAKKYESVRSDFANQVEALAETRRRLELERGELEQKLREKSEELLVTQKRYQEALRLASQLREEEAKAERGRKEVVLELERAVLHLRDQQELLEALQQRVRAAETPKGPLEERPASDGDELDRSGIGKRVAALDQVIEMWREACKQKDVEILTLRSALATTQALLRDAEERLGHLRTDFQRLDMANEDLCSELDRRIAEMAIAAKQLVDALQVSDHPTVEIRTDAELADEGQLAQIAMAAAVVIAREARELKRMEEKVEILHSMQITPETVKVDVRVGASSETFVRTPARKPAWLDPEVEYC